MSPVPKGRQKYHVSLQINGILMYFRHMCKRWQNYSVPGLYICFLYIFRSCTGYKIDQISVSTVIRHAEALAQPNNPFTEDKV